MSFEIKKSVIELVKREVSVVFLFSPSGFFHRCRWAQKMKNKPGTGFISRRCFLPCQKMLQVLRAQLVLGAIFPTEWKGCVEFVILPSGGCSELTVAVRVLLLEQFIHMIN